MRCGNNDDLFEANDPEPVEVPIDGTLDLHLFQPSEVKDLVPEYILACRERGILQIRIIHGKGSGTLMRIVQSLLEEIPEVVSSKPAGEDGGGWGATIALLAPFSDRGEPERKERRGA
jgi:DNA-nicking Smr family endonuclease